MIRFRLRARSGEPSGKRSGARLSDLEDAVRVLRQCAALLRGGVAPSRVFGTLVDEREASSAAGEIRRMIADGAPASEALSHRGGPAWRLAAAGWSLAERSGAPLAPVLERLADALQALVLLDQRRSVLLSGPKATIRLVAWLPAVALLMGGLLGFDPLGVLLTPFGVGLLAMGALLETVGIRWAVQLTRSVAAADRVTAAESELMWVALRGGAPPAVARRWVAEAVDAAGAEWVPLRSLTDASMLGRILAAATASGVPPGPLLLESASAARHAAHAALERQAERLGIRVLVPLAVCILPAFVLLGVVPVLISLFGGVGSA